MAVLNRLLGILRGSSARRGAPHTRPPMATGGPRTHTTGPHAGGPRSARGLIGSLLGRRRPL